VKPCLLEVCMRPSVTTYLPALLGVGLLAGCPDRTISEVNPQQQGAVKKAIPVSADIDILFVIDNSSSTNDKQTVFAANFPKFVAALDAFPTGRPNLHIGVVDTTVDINFQGFAGCPSPDPNDNGLLQNTPRVTGCTPPTGRFISDVKDSSGGRTTNYTGTLDQAFSCIAQVGANGCGFEADLEAMKRALDGSRPENAGFIRNGAYLAIVFLTDEDDASLKPLDAADPDKYDPTVWSKCNNAAGGPGDFCVQPLFAYTCDTPISASQPGNYTNCFPRTDSYLRDPNDYFAFLTSVKPPEQIVVAAVMGPPAMNDGANAPGGALSSIGMKEPISTGMLTFSTGQTQNLALLPTCNATINGNMAFARPGLRLGIFLANFGQNRGRAYTVCQGDYSAALTDIGNLLFNAVSPCLEGDVDTRDIDPNNPGTQLDCTVTDVQNEGTTSQTSTLVPACKMSAPGTVDPSSPKPCWWSDSNATSCPTTSTHYEINFDRGGMVPPTGTTTEVECAICPVPLTNGQCMVM
jgi:hypothetical protein